MFTRKNRNSIQVMSQSFGHHPETSIRRKIPNRNAFLSKFLNKIFLSKQSDSRNLIPQQGCSILLSPEGVISTPRLGQIVHRNIIHLPHSHFKGHQSHSFQITFHPRAVVKDPSTEQHGSQRRSPAKGTQTRRQKIINDHNAFIYFLNQKFDTLKTA